MEYSSILVLHTCGAIAGLLFGNAALFLRKVPTGTGGLETYFRIHADHVLKWLTHCGVREAEHGES